MHHISTVLRLEAGDELVLCDGRGTDYTVAIEHADRSEVRTRIVSSKKREITLPRITLGQGLPKSDKMDWIVQKATELGVASIIPLMTERTIVKVKDEEKRLARWRTICREAAMQSNRPDIPEVGGIVPLRDFLFTLNPDPGTLLLFPWEEGTEPVKQVLRQHPSPEHIVVLIGPEGGFSRTEAGQARGKGFHLASLGQNILRTETAALATLALIGYEYH